MKWIVILAGIFGFLGVGAGAFGAHALESRLEPRMLEIWETAARYQMYHAVALIGVAWIYSQTEHVAATVAGWAFATGIVVFSGSLFLLALTGTRWLGAITPLGGLAFLIGWICCIVAAVNGFK